MYTSKNTHRLPALVLAAGFTIAVMGGLSALAHTTPTHSTFDAQALAQGTLAGRAASTPTHIDVVAHRSSTIAS